MHFLKTVYEEWFYPQNAWMEPELRYADYYYFYNFEGTGGPSYEYSYLWHGPGPRYLLNQGTQLVQLGETHAVAVAEQPVRYKRVTQDYGVADFPVSGVIGYATTLSLPSTSPPCTGSAFQMQVSFDKDSNATLHGQYDPRNFVTAVSGGQYRVNGWSLENVTSSTPNFNIRLQRISPGNTNKPIRVNAAGYTPLKGFSVMAQVKITCD